jgi:hypothetical protein
VGLEEPGEPFVRRRIGGHGRGFGHADSPRRHPLGLQVVNARRLASEPEPVKASPRFSRRACTVPSSPEPPWRPRKNVRPRASEESRAAERWGHERALSGEKSRSKGRSNARSSRRPTEATDPSGLQNQRDALSRNVATFWAEATETRRSLPSPKYRESRGMDSGAAEWARGLSERSVCGSLTGSSSRGCSSFGTTTTSFAKRSPGSPGLEREHSLAFQSHEPAGLGPAGTRMRARSRRVGTSISAPAPPGGNHGHRRTGRLLASIERVGLDLDFG